MHANAAEQTGYCGSWRCEADRKDAKDTNEKRTKMKNGRIGEKRKKRKNKEEEEKDDDDDDNDDVRRLTDGPILKFANEVPPIWTCRFRDLAEKRDDDERQ